MWLTDLLFNKKTKEGFHSAQPRVNSLRLHSPVLLVFNPGFCIFAGDFFCAVFFPFAYKVKKATSGDKRVADGIGFTLSSVLISKIVFDVLLSGNLKGREFF